MSSSLLDIFATITDPRRAQGKMYGLAPVLKVSVLAVLFGATSYRKIHGFIDNHLSRLNKAFGFGWRKAPAYSSVRTILHGLDPLAIEKAFRERFFTSPFEGRVCPYFGRSSNPCGDRFGEVRHTVENLDANRQLHRLGIVVAGMQSVADDRFVATHRRLDRAAPTIAIGLLPCIRPLASRSRM